MSRALTLLIRILAAVTAVAAVAILALSFVPRPFGYDPIVVVNGSMGDAMPLGSIAYTKQTRVEDISEGDIVSFLPEGSDLPTTHRVVGIEELEGEPAFTTRGDANASEDPEVVTFEDGLVPRVERVVPFVGTMVEQARTPIGALLLIGIPIAGLMLDRGKGRRRKKGRHSAGWVADEQEDRSPHQGFVPPPPPPVEAFRPPPPPMPVAPIVFQPPTIVYQPPPIVVEGSGRTIYQAPAIVYRPTGPAEYQAVATHPAADVVSAAAPAPPPPPPREVPSTSPEETPARLTAVRSQ